jgi:hypothetical protein
MRDRWRGGGRWVVSEQLGGGAFLARKMQVLSQSVEAQEESSAGRRGRGGRRVFEVVQEESSTGRKQRN